MTTKLNVYPHPEKDIIQISIGDMMSVLVSEDEAADLVSDLAKAVKCLMKNRESRQAPTTSQRA